MAKGDDRAVVGSSGRPLKGMVLESGTKEISKRLGRYTRPNDDLRTTGGHFNVDEMQDKSIGGPPDGS